jgi:hypothetical protein
MLKKIIFIFTDIYIQVYTYAAPETGHWHGPCPLAIWGLWIIPLPPQHAANRPIGRSCLLAEAVAPVPVPVPVSRYWAPLTRYWAMPGGARWDRKVSTKLAKKYFIYSLFHHTLPIYKCICVYTYI